MGDLSSTPASGRRRALAVVTGAVALTVAFFYRAAFSPEIFITRDIFKVYYPLRRYWAERISQGSFPRWYPFDGLGQPFAGMMISGAFHPSNLLYLALPLGAALKVNTLLCYPVALLGVFLLLRRFGASAGPAVLAALLFAFCGYMVSITNNLLYLMAAATFPWALWAADRFFSAPSVLRACAAALILTLVLLCGDPQSFVVCSALTGALAWARHRSGQARRTFGMLIGLLGLAALFSAVQILPLAPVVTFGRAGQPTLDIAEMWSLHPLRLLDVALGPFFGGDSASMMSYDIDQHLLKEGNSTLWVETLTFGLPGLVLAGAGLLHHRRSRGVRIAFVCWLGLLLLSLGSHGGLYTLFFKLLPFWRPFRYPQKLLPYVMFGLALAAGAGLQAALDNATLRRRLAWALGVATLACGLVWGAERWGSLLVHHGFSALWSQTPVPGALDRLHEALLVALVRTAVACLLCALVLWRFGERPLGGGLLCGLTFLYLFVSNENLYLLTYPGMLEEPIGFIREYEQREGGIRLGGARVASAAWILTVTELPGVSFADSYAVSVAMSLQPDGPAIWGLESADAYLPAASHRVFTLSQPNPNWYKRFAGLVGARYLTIDSRSYQEIGGTRDVIIAENKPLQLLLLRNPGARPRAYLTRPRCVASADEALKLLTSAPSSVLAHEAPVECPAGLQLPPSPEGELGEARVVSYAPERVELEVAARGDALLVLNDAWYPGWSVTVDGQPAQLRVANYAVRGVSVTAGTHRVVFTFQDKALAAGAWVSGLSLLASLGLGLVRRRSVPKRSSGSPDDGPAPTAA